MAYDIPTTPQLPPVPGNAIPQAQTPGLLQTPNNVTAPWNSTTPGASSVVSSSFFPPITIDGARWNGFFPYRLIVVQQNSNGTYQVVGGSPSAANAVSNPLGVLPTALSNIVPRMSSSSTLSGSRLNIQFSPIGNSWEYRLPITPQQLSISTLYTAQVEATLGGIVEQNGGVKFKIIQAAGSFGVLPFRDTKNPIGNQSVLSNELNAVFGGTLQAAQNVVGSAVGVVNGLISGYPKTPPIASNVSKTSTGLEGTGYSQCLLLDQFLEQYSEAKRNPANASWRLAFDIPKQNQTFLVTPLQFAYSQAMDAPNEYKFNFQLKAWKRISISGLSAEQQQVSGVSLGTSLITRGLRTIGQLQQTVSSIYGLISAVRSDALTIDNAIKSTAVFCKQLLGIGAAVSDLPRAIAADFNSAVADAAATFAKTNTGVGNSVFGAIAAQQRRNEGLPFSAVAGGQLGSNAAYSSNLTTLPLNVLNLGPSSYQSPVNLGSTFNPTQLTSGLGPQVPTPQALTAALQQLPTSSLTLNPAQLASMNNYFNQVSLYTVQDLMNNLAVLQDVAFKLGNAFDGGDVEYNKIYGKPPPSTRSYPMTTDEFSILQDFYDSIQFLLTMTATNQLNAQNIQNTYEYVRNLALASNIPFDDATSKTRVPVPFNLTIEQISMRYLGNPNKWNEIATLNGLQEPYIDETGFYLPLLTNPYQYEYNVANVDNLYIGQSISLSATGMPTLYAHISKIQNISLNNYLVTLDTEFDLTGYTVGNNAQLHAYLPGTVNSQNFIWIPSTLPVPDNLITRPIPVTQSNTLTTLSKIDLLLTDNFDIAIDQFGNLKLAYGLSNLLQALKLKLQTQPGALITHPSFGAGIQPGTSFADIATGAIYSIIEQNIQSDPRFAGLQALQVQIEPPSMKINLSARIANGVGVFPLSFNIV